MQCKLLRCTPQQQIPQTRCFLLSKNHGTTQRLTSIFRVTAVLPFVIIKPLNRITATLLQPFCALFQLWLHLNTRRSFDTEGGNIDSSDISIYVIGKEKVTIKILHQPKFKLSIIKKSSDVLLVDIDLDSVVTLLQRIIKEKRKIPCNIKYHISHFSLTTPEFYFTYHVVSSCQMINVSHLSFSCTTLSTADCYIF